MKNFIVIFMLLLPLLVTCNADAQAKDTPHYDVVAEYIRSLGAIHNIQQTAIREYQEAEDKDNPVKKVLVGIQISTRFKLELRTSIGVLKRMKLKKPFDELIPNTISFYQRKIELFDESIKISKNFVDTVPKPGVDYSGMLARMPEITALNDYIDETIFQ
jgi:hypothetical protein